MSEAMQALYAGKVDKAHELLADDTELSVFDAAAFGRVDRLRELLDADPTAVESFSEDGFTPLHLAVFANQEEAAGLLIERGAGVDVISRGDIARVPPLGTAAFARTVALARVLLDAGADVNLQAEGGFTALHGAAQHGDVELVELLLERGADPAITTADGKRAADFAAADEVRSLL